MLIELLNTNAAAVEETDGELRDLLREEIREMETDLIGMETEIFKKVCESSSLVESKNQKMEIEIQAGAGFASGGVFIDRLWNVYMDYFEHMGWNIDFENITYDYMTKSMKRPSKLPTLIKFTADGANCVDLFNAERGIHKIQEVTFNSTKMQTYTIQVKVYPIIETKITKNIPKEEFKWKLVRGSGKGGMKIQAQNLCPYVVHIPVMVDICMSHSL